MISANMESRTELQNWKRQNQSSTTTHHKIDCYSAGTLLSRERGIFMWGEHFPEVATPWDHPYVTSQTSPAPKQHKHDKAGASNYEALHVPQYRAEWFLNDYV